MTSPVAPAEDPTRRAEPDRRAPAWLAWAVLATAIAQVVAPALTFNGPGESPGSGAGPDLLITPVGWAFSIWGVIYLLAIVHAVAVLIARRQGVPRRLLIDQLVLYVGATAWIVCAGLDSSVATAAALTVMFVAALDAVLIAARAGGMPRWLVVVTNTAVGLYAGWVSAAFFLNVSTALVDSDVASADALAWQLAMLVVAVLVLLAVLVGARGTPTYAAAGVWALVGIAVTGRTDGNGEVVLVALVSAALVAITAAALWLGGRRPVVATKS